MEEKNTLASLAEMVDGQLLGDGKTLIHGFAPLETAGDGEISFLAQPKRVDLLAGTKASAVLVPMAIEECERNCIRVNDPYLASAIIHTFFLKKPFVARGIHEAAVIGTDCTISDQVSIGPLVAIGDGVRIGHRVEIYAGTVIGDGVIIGDDTVIKANVTIEADCCIGSRVILHPGVVVGSDGYGYAPNRQGCHIKRPQVGSVRIEDDVEIGANCCIDRATYGITLIKKGVKIDNLVQVAHNVVVGENSLLVAQVGIAGSTTLGRNVVMGGKAAAKGHIHLDDGAMVAAKSGVHNNLAKGEVVGGTPAISLKKWVKAASVYAKLPEMWKELKKIRKEIEEIQGKRE